MAGIPPTTLYLWGCRNSCRVHKTKTPAPTARHSCFIPLCQISSRNSCRNSAAHWTLSKTSYAVPRSAGPLRHGGGSGRRSFGYMYLYVLHYVYVTYETYIHTCIQTALCCVYMYGHTYIYIYIYIYIYCF